MFGMTNVASRPRMMMTTMISIRVKPSLWASMRSLLMALVFIIVPMILHCWLNLRIALQQSVPMALGPENELNNLAHSTLPPGALGHQMRGNLDLINGVGHRDCEAYPS